MERDPRAVVSPVSKGRFRNVTCLCVENLANLKLETAVMQRETSRSWFYTSATQLSLYYIIRYRRFSQRWAWWLCSIYGVYGIVCGRSVYITRRGQAQGCLSLRRGNARAWLEGIGAERHTPTSFFVSKKFGCFLKMANMTDRGVPARLPCVQLSAQPRHNPVPLNRKNKVFIFKHF